MPIRKITGSTSGLVAVAQVRSSPLNVKATVTQRNLLAITNTNIDVVKASTVVNRLVGGSRTDLEGLVRLFKEYQYIKDNSRLLITKNFFDDVPMVDLAGVYDGALFEFDQYHNEAQFILELLLLNLNTDRKYFDDVSIISRPSLEPQIPRADALTAFDEQPPLLINLGRDEPIPTTDVESHVTDTKREFPDVLEVLEYFTRIFEAYLVVDTDIISGEDLAALTNFKIQLDELNVTDVSVLDNTKLFTDLITAVSKSSLDLNKVFADITTMIDLTGVYDGAQFELDQNFFNEVTIDLANSFIITKDFTDIETVQELKSIGFFPATKVDSVSSSDFRFLSPNLGRNEPILTSERIKNFGITWLKKEIVNPVERKFMAFTMHPFKDNVVILDDSYATLLTIIYAADTTLLSEKIKFFTIGKGLNDTPIPVEYLTRIVNFYRAGAGFTDVANPIERIYNQLNKPASDVFSLTDFAVPLRGKVPLDILTYTDFKTFSITNLRAESTQPVERKYLLVTKPVNDVQSILDSIVASGGYNKYPKDTLVLSDRDQLLISKTFNDITAMIDLAGVYDGAIFSLLIREQDSQSFDDDILIYRDKGWRDFVNVGQYPYNANLFTYSEDFTNAAWTETATTTTNNGGNMLLYSEQIDNAAWTRVLTGTSAFTANAGGNPYDGGITSDAYTVPPNATINVNISQSLINSLTVGVTYTFSVWLYPTILSAQPLTVWNGIGRLGTTAVTTSFSLPANTWSRKSVSFVASTSTVTVAVRDVGANSTTAYNTYIWGAQVNTGNTALTYTQTTAAPVGQLTSPVGTSPVTYLQEDNAATAHAVASTALLFTSGVTSIVSVYANSDGQGRYLTFTGGGLASVLQSPVFDVVNGTVATSSGTSNLKSAMIEHVGGGWFRCSAVVVPSGNGTVIFSLNNTYTPGVNPSYTGQIGRGIFLWGAQIVATTGNVYTAITPYIRTTSAAILVNVPTRSGPFERVEFDVTKPLNPEAFTPIDRDYLRLNRGAELDDFSLTDNNVTRPNLGKKETVATNTVPEIVNFEIFKTARRGVGGTLLVNTIDANPDLDYRNSSVAITQVANSPDAVGTLDMFYRTIATQRDEAREVTITDVFKYYPGKVIYPADSFTMLDTFDYADNLIYTLLLRESDVQSIVDSKPEKYFEMFVPFYPGAGVVGTRNLFTYSEQFDTSITLGWTTSAAFITPNVVTAPDGLTTADKFTENGANSVHSFDAATGNNSASLSGVTSNLSIFAKSAGQSRYLVFGALGQGAGGNQFPVFNLETGTVLYGTGAVTKSATIEPVGDGWYRCSTVLVPANTNNGTVYLSNTYALTNSAPSYTGTSGSGIYIWGAQITRGSRLYDYIPTTSTTVTFLPYESIETITPSDLITLYLKQISRNFVDDFITIGGMIDDGSRPQVYSTSETLKFTITKRFGDSFDSIDFATASDGLTFNSSMLERDLFITADNKSFEIDKNIPEAGVFSINLLKYSEEFANPVWSTSNITAAVTSNANILSNAIAAPDGTITADKLREGATSSYHTVWYNSLGPVTTGTTQTFSAYAKAAERPRIYLQIANQSSTYRTVQAAFDLSSGTVVAGSFAATGDYTTSNGQASITSVGNGWYLCSITGTKISGLSTSSIPIIFTATSSSAFYLGVSGAGVYVWGAHLYNSVKVDYPYIKTTGSSRFVTNSDLETINPDESLNFQITTRRADSTRVGNIAESAVGRNNFNGSENISFLIAQGAERDTIITDEAQSLETRLFINLVPGLKYGNQLKFSEDLTNAVWVNSNLQEVANQLTAPNGTLTAEKLQENNTNNAAHYVYYAALGATSNTTQTFSLYVKAGQRSLVGIGLSNMSSSAANCYADLSSGTILLTNEAGTDYSNITSTITSVGSGWYRLSMTADKAAVNTSSVPQIIMVSGTAASYTTTYPGVVGSGIYAWGAQLNSDVVPYEYTATTANTVSAYQYRVRDNDVFTADTSDHLIGMNHNESMLFGNAVDNGTRPQANGAAETLKFLITKPFADSSNIDEQLIHAIPYIRGIRDGFVESVIAGNQDVVDYQNNALTYSEQFETAASWSTSNAYVTSNAIIAPDGTLTADKLSETSSVAAGHAIQELSIILASSAGVVYNVSVYAKSAGQGRYLTFSGLGIGSVGQAPTFNLDTGTVYTTSTTTYVKSVAITPAGNGWYRCSMVVVPTANSPALFYLSNTSTTLIQTTHAGVTGTGIYIWGAQITTGSTLYAYTRTTSTALVNNMLAIEPLSELEPIDVRINKRFVRREYGNEFSWSEEFQRSVWNQTGSNITTDVIVAPDGTLTADKLIEGGTFNTHSIEQNYTTPELFTRYTLSTFVKAGERHIINLQLTNNINTTQASFNLSSGVVSATSGGVNGWKVSQASMSLVGDGWYRCRISATLINLPGSNITGVIALNNGSTTNYNGDGTSGVYLWGGQLNIGEMVEYTQTTSAAISGFVIDDNFVSTDDLITNFDSTKGILGDPTDINIVSSQGTVYTLFGNAYVEAVYFAEDYAEYTPVVRSIT